MSSASRDLIIANQRGLHARAAAKFVKVAADYEATIRVCHGGTEVCGTSIMGLMMLAAAQGTAILVSAQGIDAQGAVDALTTLVENRFDE